jgi:Gluconate 2-dehydrogenase subunit 3
VSTNGGSSLVELNPRENSLQREILSRREVARRILGVTAAWSLGGIHPVWGHLLNEAPLPAHGDIDLANADWKPLFLASEQNEALQSLSEAMIPGSTNALVNRFIDLLLSVDSPAHQQKFIASLSAMQAEGDRQFGKSFPLLSASQRDSLLASVSSSPESSASRKSFDDLKEWIVASYYSSEAGMKELGWTSNRFFPSFPGCTHPDGHL